MSRRVSLPSADDLFRATEGTEETEAPEVRGPGLRNSEGAAAPPKPTGRGTVHAVPDRPDNDAPSAARRRASGRPSRRVRHDEKVTVYVTSSELLEIEHARLSLRGEHGLVVDRGRLVREAIGLVLADLQRNGHDSALVRRLSEE